MLTARVDELEFHTPILIGDLVTCSAEVNYGVYCKKRCIASYYIYTDGTACYFAAEHAFRRLEGEDIPEGFKHSLE